MEKLRKIIPRSGTCDVCGSKTLLSYQCKLTGLTVGNCCFSDMRIADRLLSSIMPYVQIRHPFPGETTRA